MSQVEGDIVSVPTPLSHGQLYSWREVESYPPDWKQEANLSATWELFGLPAARVKAALRRLVELYEPLRTTYHVRDGVPAQRVDPLSVNENTGLPEAIELIDRVFDYRDPDRTTDELVTHPFAMTGGLCWRGVLVTTGGAPMYLSLSFSHLILDVWSVRELHRQFRLLVAVPTSDVEVGVSQRELAAQQRTDAGQARQAGAEKHWRKVLADELVHHPPTLPTGVTRSRIQATLQSHRLGALAAAAAQRHGATAPAVLLALVTAGLAEHTGAERVAISLMSANRFAPEHRRVVGTLNQLVPIAVTVDPRLSLAEHVKALHWASARAYRHSCYDLDRIVAIAAETGATAAHDCAYNQLFPCWFNYLHFDDIPPVEDTPAELVWTPLARQYGQPFDVRVTVADGRTSVALRVDPDLIGEDGLVAILRAVALGTERAVTDPDSSLKDLWGPHDLPPSLFPLEVPSRMEQP